MSVCVVVPLDGGQVGIIGQEDRSHQTLILLTPETRRNGQVAFLIHDLMTLAKDGVVAAEQHACVSMVQLHTDAGGGMAMTSSIDKIDSFVVCYIWSPTIRIGSDVTILNRKDMITEYLHSILSPASYPRL